MEEGLIIGSGIAGPVAAMALAQAGIEAVVYEAHERSAGLEVGAYLTVAVNGLDALQAIGLDDAVKAAGFPTPSIEFYNGQGRELGLVPIGGTLEDGTVTHSIKRVDLYRLLSDEAERRGVRIEHGRKLVGAESNSNEVTAHFEDGSTASGAFLIGADGIHSTVRTLVDADAPRPRYTGLGNIGGFSSATIYGRQAGQYRMIFGKHAFFGYTVSPDGEIWWFGNPPSSEPLSREALQGATNESWIPRLLELYADDLGPASEIIRCTTGPISVTNQYEMPTTPIWHRGRMAIIGDAAHAASPTSGQGASMAIEDGVVLAKCLRDCQSPTEAFETFESLRRVRVERVVAFGAERNAGKMPGPAGRLVRDLALPRLLRRHSSPKAMANLSWLFDHHIDWQARVEVSEG